MLFGLIKRNAQPLRCPDCDVDMDFLQAQYTSHVFVSTLLERAFFRCPNCQRLSDRLAAMPATFHREHSHQPMCANGKPSFGSDKRP
jgi:uncharacterized C2H2 Zn-finger protein